MPTHWIPTWTCNPYMDLMMCCLHTSGLMTICSPLHIMWPSTWNWFSSSALLLNSWTFYLPITDKWTLALHITYAIGLCKISVQFSSVQSLSHVQLFATPWITARQASLSVTNSQSSLRLMSIESVMPSSHLILRRPLLLLPPIPPSIRVFSNESTLHKRWPKYWNFSFSIIPSKEIPGLISFRMDWLDLDRCYIISHCLKQLLNYSDLNIYHYV